MTGAAEVPPRLEVRELSKTFAGVTVLDRASLSIAAGEIHALIGQNGSGKSTLIKLISGVYAADHGGEILVDGERIGPPVRAAQLQDQGLAFVHQDLGLIEDLSVRDNVRVGRYSANRFTRWIDSRKDTESTRRTLDFLGLRIDPATRVSTLRPSERVAVAVARALQDRSAGTGVIVFDESSRAIPHDSLPAFYEMIHRLADEGTAVLFVSHNLKEVLQVADRVTALRNGRVVETGVPTESLDEEKLTSLVLGRAASLGDIMQQVPLVPSEETVTLQAVAGGRVRGVDAEIRRGEVVGFTGTIDSGLPDLGGLLGGDVRGEGTVVVRGREVDLSRSSSSDLIRAGVAMIPQDRHAKGIAMDLTVEENVTLPHLTSRGTPFWMGLRWQREETLSIIDRFDVQPRLRGSIVATLSGGNQQKVLMGKWLIGDPAFLVLDDPTQAVDVGARHAVLTASRQAAAEGAAVAFCSAEVEDLAAVCDRVYVLDDGRVVEEIVRPFTADDILSATFRRHAERAAR